LIVYDIFTAFAAKKIDTDVFGGLWATISPKDPFRMMQVRCWRDEIAPTTRLESKEN
jgi:hypothetical protein